MRRIISLCMACLATAALLAQQKYKLTLKSDPDGIIEYYSVVNGETNYLFTDDNGDYVYYTAETISIPAGAKVRLRPHYNSFRRDARSYYRFTEQFTQQQNIPVEIEMTYDRNGDFDHADFIMPDYDITLVEHFVYDPGNIGNPNPQPNFWDAAAGTLIVDNIERGDWDAFRNTVPETERDLVQKIIVSGTFMTAGMMEHLSIYPNLQVVDLSRTTLTEIGGWRYREWFDAALNALTDVLLPSTMRTINGYGFNQKPLQNITCFAVTPPEVTATDCFTNPDMTVFVPAEAITLYQKAPVWKDFTILPIDQNAAPLTIGFDISNDELPMLRNMTLELVNTKTQQVRRMVVGSRKEYTFRSLPVNTVYDVQLVNGRGIVLAQQQNVYVDDDGANVSFTSTAIHWPHDLRLVTSLGFTYDYQDASIHVSWNDALGNLIEHGPTVHGVVNGQQLQAIIRLDNISRWLYYKMEDTLSITVTDSMLTHVYKLVEVPRCRYQVNVRPFLRGGSYNISFAQPLATGQRQLYSGAVPDASTNVADPRYWFNYIEFTELEGLPQGIYDITVCDRSGQYATQTQRVEVRPKGELNIYMAPNRGQWIQLDYTYTEAADGDTSPSPTAGLPDGTLLRFALHNVTTGEDIGGVARVNDRELRLSQPLPVGTQLLLTATDPDGELAPATATATVEHADSTLHFALNIVERGSIEINTPTRGTYVLLFDSGGQLVNRYRCGVQQDTLFVAVTEPLPAGNYTVVGLTGGEGNLGTLLGALLTLGDVQRLLTEGDDYVKSSVSVSDARWQLVKWDAVPAVNSNIQRFIDNRRTNLSLSKTELVVGSYQTLRLQLAFREEYAAEVNDVVVTTRDLATNTEHSAYVDGSTMVGNTVYSFGNSRSISLGRDYARQMRECWLAREASDDAKLMMKVTFKYQGQTYTEYLSTDTYIIDDATMQAPLTTSTPEFIASGQATPGSTIEVYDDQRILLGAATASPSGDWMAQCTLHGQPLMNNSAHIVNAFITNPETGQTVTTAEVMVVYEQGHVKPKTVEMSFFNYHPVHMFTERFVWDYETMQPQAKSYNFSNLPGVPTDITFTVDLTENDTTVVSQVMLWVFTTGSERYRKLECVYDKEQNRWVAKDIFNTTSLPHNIHVEVTSHRQPLADKRMVNTLLGDLNSWKADKQRIDQEVNTIFSQMEALLEQYGAEASAKMRSLLMQLYQLTDDDFTTLEDGIKDFVLNEEDFDWAFDEADRLLALYQPTIDGIFTTDLFDASCYSKVPGLTIRTADGLTRTALLQDGYEEMPTGEAPFYIKITPTLVSLVSLADNIVFTLNMSAIAGARAATAFRAGSGGDALSWFVSTIDYLGKKGDEFFAELSSFFSAVDQCIDRLTKVANEIEPSYQALNKSFWAYVRSAEGRENVVRLGIKFAKLKGLSGFRGSVKWALKKLENLKAGKWGGKLISVASLMRNIRDELKEMEELKRLYTMVPTECPREQDKADRLRDDIYSAARSTAMYYSSLITGDLASIGVTFGGLIAAPETGGISLGAVVAAMAAIAVNYWALLKHNEQTAAMVEGFRYKVKQLECKKRDLKPGDEVDGCWRDDGDNFNIDSGRAGANLFKRNKRTNKLWQFFEGLMGGDSDGDGSNCGPKPDPDGGNGDGDGSNGGGRGGRGGGGSRGGRNGGDFPGGSQPILDPSGYVYEAVASNRVQGATATIYYKEAYEDMYGDKRERIVVWNAEEYAQHNPLFTDENGEYAWDVPQGLWQVKFEKQGYQTTTTEWLPVPPPQLDINVPMSQFSQPVVMRARATEQGVSLTFDKWMKPATLTTDAITVTLNGNAVEGTLQLLDQTYSPDSVAYVRSLRFVPSTVGGAGGGFSLGQQLTLTVAPTAESYAGVTMAEAYTQTFDVERVVEAIVADSLVTFLYGQQKQITINALPAEAASGKVLTITSMATDIATADVQSVTLGTDGKATFTISGKLLGTTALRLSIEQDDVEKYVMVGVKEKNDFICAEPKSSIATGSVVDFGTRLYLSSTTDGASIIYTLDGSCLCSDSGTLSVYDPVKGIVLNQDAYEVTVRCMAVAEGIEDSDEAVFVYYIRQNGQPQPQPVTITIQTADAGYCTFFDSAHDFLLPEGLTASVVSGVQNGRLVYQPITSGIIPQGTAVLIEATPRQAATFTLTSTTAVGVPAVGTNLLHGSDDDVWTTANGDNLFYKLCYGPSGTSLAQSFGWFWGEASGGAFIIGGRHKGWLAVPRAIGARAYLISGQGTGIEEKLDRESSKDKYYDLQGRIVRRSSTSEAAEPSATFKKGIYLHNGHKIVVK